jgi:multidrug efflux pump subunit AcrB/outer membrane protein TolC
MSMVRSSLRYPAVTLTLAAMLFLAGLVSLLKMPRREDPKITIRAGLAIAWYPGASAEQVEAQVTRKIEERLFRFAEVKKRKTFSTSRDGLVIVQIELEDWVKDPDLFWSKLRHDMNELKARELPQEVRGITVDGDFGDTVALLIAISGDRYGYRELKEYANRIEDALRSIPTTSKIKRYGEQREQIEVATSLSRLSQYRVTPGRIIKALQDQNVVEYAGSFETDRGDVPLQTSGLFHKEEQVRRLMVDVSPVTGQPVYLGDFTDVRRRYVDPESFVRVDGDAAVMLSVEMQDGKNIVEFGHAVDAKLAEVRGTLPPDLKLTLVANQPRVVEERISHFNREFLIAIIAVVLVTMLLLPWRVATIAAVAIPVTIAVTFAALDAVGVELHQVSIAALIIVLGMVVDDAIVIADNYVELLDHGLARTEAAWRSASDLAAPVLAATLTIIASFLPLAWLSGTTGEFIRALPITVTVSLFCSYVVAMVVTPILAFHFIRKGLKAHDAGHAPASLPAPKTWLARTRNGVRAFSALDAMERLYDAAIRIAMPRKAATLAFGVVAFVAGVVGLQFVGDKFFPSAERDQFVVDVWMPEGARLGATDDAVRKVEAALRQTPGITNIATMVGAGAPRFYYAISPEMSTTAYAQVVVNTTSPEITPHLVSRLGRSLPALAPEAHIMVKELMQGATAAAPIEIRITSGDLDTLKSVAARVQKVVEATTGTRDVTTDFRGDTYRLAVKVDQEAASRVGLTSAAISQHLAGGFEGATVSTFWEGSRAVDIALRLGEGERVRFDDIGSTYITSEATGARIPLSQVATFTPVWEPSRIVRRNGLRTLTVRSFAEEGLLASEVLATMRATLDTMPLPVGTTIAYGGEFENQNDTQGEMSIALVVSLVLIFLILLLQFRSLALPLVVMASIPLSVVGAVLGLLLTGNPFSFTAFLGVIGLMGLVVRNAIILVDYMNEQIAHGMPLEDAAIEAGRRRLRPIFLTTIAAAAGVLPMIISGSSMWSPLASVLAMGLITSMIFTLLVVPVLYVVVMRRGLAATPSPATPAMESHGFAPVPAMAGMHASMHASMHQGVVAGLVALLAVGAAASPASAQRAQEVSGRITLEQATDIALHNNRGVRVARSRADEAARHRQGSERALLPSITADFQTIRSTGNQSILFPAGSLGGDASGPLPAEDVTIEQGGRTTSYGTVTIAQPLTSLVKIRAARDMARADWRAAEADARDAELEVGLAVEKLYYGLLVAQQRRRAAGLRLAAAEEGLQHRLRNVATGASLEVAALEGRTAALDARQGIMAADDEIADLAAQLSEAMGATVDPKVELVPPARPSDADSLAIAPAQLVAAALSSSPDVEAAGHQLHKAESALTATRASYIPDVSLFGMEMYQNAVALLPETQFSFGIKAQWTVFDFGRREADVAERRASRRTAEENLARVRNQVTSQVEQAERKVQRAARSAALAGEVLALRREALRIKRDQAGTGLVLVTEQRDAEATVASAEADWLAAEAGHRIAIAELRRVVGRSR